MYVFSNTRELLLDTYRKKERRLIKCPRCGKLGFWSKRWAASSYYPQESAAYILKYEELMDKFKSKTISESEISALKILKNRIKGTKFSGPKTKGLAYPTNEETEHNNVYRIRSRKVEHHYIGHYDSEKYKANLERYRKGELKSRPNGRKWCKLRKEDYHIKYIGRYRELLILKNGEIIIDRLF